MQATGPKQDQQFHQYPINIENLYNVENNII